MKTFPGVQLRNFKNVTSLKNKTNQGIYFAIPKGENIFLWFTYDNGNPICYECYKQKMIIINASFNHNICLGTIVGAVKFKYNNKVFYAINDIYKYKGKQLSQFNITYLHLFIENIKNVTDFIIFGVPLYNKNLNELLNDTRTLCYNIYIIQYRYKNYPYLNQKYLKHDKINNVIFKVKPDIKDDIYKLYCLNDEYYSNALIPNIKLSIFMNNIFRYIKENENIDLIEESDDEEEFENIEIDKFLRIREKFMECEYNQKFKMWIPCALVNKDELILKSKTEISELEK